MAMPFVLVFIVNGEDAEIGITDFDEPLREARNRALEETGNTGRPRDEWEVRTTDGTQIDVARSVSDLGLASWTRLILSLQAGAGGVATAGVPVLRIDGTGRSPEDDPVGGRVREVDMSEVPATTPEILLGAVCKHDQLARKCERCDDERDFHRALHLLWRVRDAGVGVEGAVMPYSKIKAFLDEMDEMGLGKAPPVSIYSRSDPLREFGVSSVCVTSPPCGGTP